MFWKYFCDQNLFETKTNPTEKRSKNLIDALNAIYAIDNRPFLTGFLGHAMYIDQLVELFEKAVIIRVKRQMLASALSMLKYIKRSDGSFGPLGSAIPRQCQDISDLTPHQQVAHQVFFINRGLDAYQEKYKNLIFEADYNKTCSSPQQFIEKVEEFLNQNRIQVKLRTDVKLPKAFQPHIVSRSQNEDTRKIADELDALVESFGPVSVQCY
jgi:hypothetical protein